MKKVISVLLSIYMIFGGLPLMAFAVNITPEIPLDEFLSSLSELQKEYDDSYVAEIIFDNGSEFYRKNGEMFPVEGENGELCNAVIAENDFEIPKSVLYFNCAEQEEAEFSAFDLREDNNIIEYAEKLGYDVEISNGTAVLSQPYQTHRLIVKSKFNVDALDSVEIVEGYNGLHIVQFDSLESTLDAFEYYNSRKTVEYVEPDIVLSTESYEKLDLSEFSKAALYGNHLSWGSEAIGVDDYIDYIEDVSALPEITVAIIDSGIDLDHEFLKDRIVNTNFNNSTSGIKDSEDDDNGHGSHVAGIIVDNTTSNVKIKAYKALNSKGSGTIINIVAAIDKAVEDGVNVINMSLGAKGYSTLMENSVKNAVENGIAVCVSAGNSGDYASNYIPARIDECITVAAFGMNDSRPVWTNYGSAVDILAPGVSIYSTFSNNTYANLSGTSMAAPFVSAACALILSKNFNFHSDEIINLINENGRYCNNEYYDVNLNDVKAIFIGDLTIEEKSRTAMPVFSTPGGKYYDEVTVSISCSENAEIYYTLDGSRATKTYAIPYTGPITLTESANIHAVAFCEGKLKSLQAIETYYVVTKDAESNFEIDDNGIITAYYGTNDYLSIPEKINGITVKGIGESVFENSLVKETVTMVEAPDTLTCVGKNAFSICPNLTSFYCQNLKTVGDFAFQQCRNLEDIDLSNLEEIGEYSFFFCNNINQLKNSNLTVIGRYAFFNLNNLIGVDLPNVVSVYEAGLSSLEKIETVNMPKLKHLGKSAFSLCTELETLNLPSLLSLDEGGYQFAYCYKLKNLNIPNVESAIPECFIYETAIETLVLKHTTILSCNALKFATSLKTLYAPKLVKLDVNSLYETNRLEFLFIPRVEYLLDFPRKSTATIYLSAKCKKSITSLPDYLNYNIIAPAESYYGKWAISEGYRLTDSYSMADDLGATIRLSDNGLRFGFSWKDYDILKKFTDSVEFGFQFDFGDVDNLYMERIAENTVYNSQTKTTSFNFVITGIPEENLNSVFSVRAYVNIDGMIFKSPVLKRSFSSVAEAVLTDSFIDEQTKQQIEEKISNPEDVV